MAEIPNLFLNLNGVPSERPSEEVEASFWHLPSVQHAAVLGKIAEQEEAGLR
ncbi:hypothetical protein [Azospirillum argentinense]|uniref:hypothetical protein n=1 Tax=Azospirillum argentinense TaxID=2970906 RepID=UPI0032DF60E8